MRQAAFVSIKHRPLKAWSGYARRMGGQGRRPHFILALISIHFFFSNFAHVSLSETVRLKMSVPGLESGSTQK